MSIDDLEKYEAEAELALYREYRDVQPMFRYVIETERHLYLANHVDLKHRTAGEDVYIELTLTDAWTWDMHRATRFVSSVRVISFGDVSIEERRADDGAVPDAPGDALR